MIDQPTLFDVTPPEHGASRKRDPDTSKEAGRAMTGDHLTEIQGDVLEFFRSNGEGTDEYLEDAYKWKHPGFSTLRKRRSELVAKGLVIDSGKRRLNRGGKKMIVWSLKY